MKALSSLIAGILFALGLGLSGMMNPQKVRGFLDITGEWDPALAFVMVGAIAIYAVAFRFIIKREKPLCYSSFSLPTKKELEWPLLIGSGVFGVGWGFAGICPGPALASISTLRLDLLIFVVMMILGLWLGAKLLKLRSH